MGKASKRKGYAAEIEVRDMLRADLGNDSVERVLLSGIRGEGDIQGLSARVEVKRQESLNVLTTFWREKNKVSNPLPFYLFARRNREPWTVTMSYEDWLKLAREEV